MKRQNPNLGCIDPHGYYPFAKDRESCPKCQAIRARVHPAPWWRRGLPYGWWKSADVWVTIVFLFTACPLLLVLLGAWFLGWDGPL